jgi:hypothetical protein
MRARIVTFACLVTLALAAHAQAAQRYAAPQGSGIECSQAAPCSLAQALGKAQNGDEVIVGTGVYTTTETLYPEGVGVDLHGDYGAPMPTVKAAFGGPVIASAFKGRVAYLEVDNLAPSGGGFLCLHGTVERVRSKVAGSGSVALGAIGACTTRDSLLLASGTKANAYVGEGFEDGLTGVVRNVTAIASGEGSTGIRSGYGLAPTGNFLLDVKNSVADGGAVDVYATESGTGNGNVVIANSNFDRPKRDTFAALTEAGGNQAAAPLFVDAAAGDYREAAGSPTIDAGIADGLGTLDLAGSARVIGAAPDIGAFEYVPPAPLGEIGSLAIAPQAFRARAKGEAILSARKKPKAPVGATITYALSAAATVQFTIERKLSGRRVGKKCVKRTKANKGKKRCPLYKPVKGGFTHTGVAGSNSFKFSGRVGGKALKPGAYRLTGATSTATRTAVFKLVK